MQLFYDGLLACYREADLACSPLHLVSALFYIDVKDICSHASDVIP